MFETIWGVTSIAFVLLIIFGIVWLKKDFKISNIFFFISMLTSGVVLVFALLYMTNNNNIRYLSSFEDYNKYEVVDYFPWKDNDKTYEFILYYDNFKLQGYIHISDNGDFNRGRYMFALTDIYGEQVYYYSEHSKDKKIEKRITSEFITKHKSKYDTFIKNIDEKSWKYK